eukprot:863127-Pleurochrysis_carterae.AAC.1
MRAGRTEVTTGAVGPTGIECARDSANAAGRRVTARMPVVLVLRYKIGRQDESDRESKGVLFYSIAFNYGGPIGSD